MSLSFRTYIVIFLLKDLFLYWVYARAVWPHLTPRGRRAALATAGAVFLTLNLPLLIVIYAGGRFGWPPSGELWKFYTYTVHSWHVTGLVVAAAVAGWMTLSGLWSLVSAIRVRPADADAGDVVDSAAAELETPLAGPQADAEALINASAVRPAFTRREMVKAALLSTPPLMFFGAFTAGMNQRGRFDVRKHVVTVPGLPAELRGLTITHISDMHIGRLVDEALLEPMVAAADELHSDLVLITGDIVDHNNAFLPACLDAFNRIDAPLGLYACMGNHDHIHDAEHFIRGFRSADVHGQGDSALLIDSSVVLRHKGRPFVVGGIDWTRSESGLRDRTAKAFSGTPPDLTRILIAHHPHAFDAGVEHGVSLTLAGHTHGGQLVFRRSDERVQLDPDTILHTGKTFALGTLMYRYVEGLYEKSGKFLFVSRGIGNWFPWRLNCPAEMTQLTLA